MKNWDQELTAIKKRLWILENPPKYAYGDKVDFNTDCYGDERTSGTVLRTHLYVGDSNGQVYYRQHCMLDCDGEIEEINQECLRRIK